MLSFYYGNDGRPKVRVSPSDIRPCDAEVTVRAHVAAPIVLPSRRPFGCRVCPRACSMGSVPDLRREKLRPWYGCCTTNLCARRPSTPRLSESLTNSNPRWDYSGMDGATSFFFVIPAFPPL